jgi:hypothetical protein
MFFSDHPLVLYLFTTDEATKKKGQFVHLFHDTIRLTLSTLI